MPTTLNPIVIGGIGGSGTRLVAQIAQQAGVNIGDPKHLNFACDFAPVSEPLRKWIEAPDNSRQARESKLEIEMIIGNHRTKASGLWGFNSLPICIPI